MKIYFINPYEESLDLYYTNIPDNTDMNSMTKLNIGYNDSYEMRSQHLSRTYFSDDPARLEAILEERRVKLIARAYEEIVEKFKHKAGNRNNAILHNSIDAPF